VRAVPRKRTFLREVAGFGRFAQHGDVRQFETARAWSGAVLAGQRQELILETFICVTCGTQFPPSANVPEHCPICEDDRQYVGAHGQQWITLGDLRASHANEVVTVDPGIAGIVTTPAFAIGQQAHLIQTPGGNVLWDCISLIDDATVERVRRLGGIAAIAISHPHFFSSMVEWAHAFDAPIFLHAEHQPWVMRPDDAIQYWTGDAREIVPGVTAVRCGGHFPGSTALHWADGADGRGALFTADTITVVADRRWVSFMYSYPDIIPLNADSVRGIVAALDPYPFDRLYGGWRDRIVAPDAKNAVRRSADRYIEHIAG
jgi:glyoxylase-like metal-dependent hydrolase (beta-lactamase superfamily II)